MRLSLRWRIILSYAALLVIAMGGLSWFLSSSVRETYLDQYRSSLMAEARILAIQLQPILQEGSPYPALDDFVAQNASLLETRITIILPDGKVIGESSRSPEQLENHLNRPEVQQALNGNVGDEIRYSDTLGTQMLYIAVPVQTGGETLGILRLAIPLAQLQANTNFILQGFLGATLLAILATVLLAGVLTNYITRPLQQLIDSVRRMSDGHLKEIELSDRSDEIGQLELEFNQLAAQLNTQIEELKSEQGKLSAVLAHMTDGILIVDEAGIVQLINPAAEQLFNLTTEEALGHSLAEVARQHQLFNLWRQCQNTAVQQSTTVELSPDRLFIQAVATPLPKAVPGGTLLVLQNFTRLRRLEIVRRDFVSNVSHELRTPLASLKALTDTLTEGALEDPPAARRFLLRMEHEIDNLTQLVQELLELSRIESRQVPLERRAVTPRDLLAPT
ncbi:MAG: cell wall metabolism sensor histidine kinase WalK, partial [Chloroflexi bacterium]|nr:cell wall metabolism sensor histidine kinase WalK [Chloroflexota bacterium]